MIEQLQRRPFDRPANALWVHRGIHCAIYLGGVAVSFNGYVRLPDGHPWLGLHYDNIPADVHGGLTYAEGNWIGFDTGHAFDYWRDEEIDANVLPQDRKQWEALHPLLKEARRLPMADWEDFWTMARLREEVERLADQVAR